MDLHCIADLITHAIPSVEEVIHAFVAALIIEALPVGGASIGEGLV